MKILITGVAGFIGFNIAKELINRGYEIIGVDVINDYYDVNLKKRRLSKLNDKNFTFCKIDISDKEKVSEIFKKEKPDTILHLAAQRILNFRSQEIVNDMILYSDWIVNSLK